MVAAGYLKQRYEYARDVNRKLKERRDFERSIQPTTNLVVHIRR
jgi:hypothetical protein